MERPHNSAESGKVELRILVRPDLYRAFMRCVWILVNEEGLTPLEAQEALVEEILRKRGC